MVEAGGVVSNGGGVVLCALSWACWKTYVGQPEAYEPRQMAMSVLGAGLSAVGNHEESLSVKEAELSMMRRIGASEEIMLVVQNNQLDAADERALRSARGSVQIRL